MNANTQNAWLIGLRWIAFVPAAIAGALLASMLLALLSRVSMAFAGIATGSFFDQLFLTTTANVVLGLAFVVIGAKVAPGHRRVVVYVLAGLAVLACGAMLTLAVVAGDGWSIVGTICTALGAGGALYYAQHDPAFRRDFFGDDPEFSSDAARSSAP